MIDRKIINFLIKAKKNTYAGKSNETIPSRLNSHDFIYKEDDFLYYDTYLGSSKFANEEALWIKNEPFWCMNYIGRVTKANFNGDFLKEALYNVTFNKPFRGPDVYKKGDYLYKCKTNGDFSWFQGLEIIEYKGIKIYECFFHGGFVR